MLGHFCCFLILKFNALEVLGVDGRIKLKLIFEKWDGEGAWAGLVWLRIGAGGGLL
jgi:hypothetical protein